MRILLAKRPRSYRHHAGVITVEPDATEEEARKEGQAKVESALETNQCPGGRGCGR